MRLPHDKHPHWSREPMVWLIIALPMAAVIGGIVTIWIAVNKADSLVNEDHYKVGFAVHQGDPLQAKAAALAIRAELEAAGGLVGIRLQGRYLEPPRGLSLTLSDPGQAGTDSLLLLPAIGGERYRGQLPPMPAGARRLVIEPTDGSWRIVGQWEAPFTGSLLLAGDVHTSASKP